MNHKRKMAFKEARRTIWHREANQQHRVERALELVKSVYHRTSFKMEVPGVGIVRQSVFTIPSLSDGGFE